MTTSEILTITRLCEHRDCTNEMVKRADETRPEFRARRFCSRSCSGAARGAQNSPTALARMKPGLLAAPPPYVPRIENGVWRPNADGWPAAPHIPQRSAQRNPR